jgi:hypothetical protein
MNTNEIMAIFRMKSNEDKIQILFGALDYMESYNGRTQSYCICLAMGYKNDTGEFNDWYK